MGHGSRTARRGLLASALLAACSAGSSAGGTRTGTSPAAGPPASNGARPEATVSQAGARSVAEGGPTRAEGAVGPTLGGEASAEALGAEVARILALPGGASTSVGGPNDGRLEGGVLLPTAGPGFRANPRRPNADAGYGTVEMVQALLRAAAVVARDVPGSELVLNDLGLPGGGPIPHHGSHQSGRDVDVLFYLLDADGNPAPSKGVPLDRTGRGTDYGDLTTPADDVPLRLDVRRTWRFFQALAEDPEALVQRIFVVEHVRAMLLAEAERVGAPAAARRLFDDLTCQPATPHDDHAHIRFFCTPEDIRAGCEDSVPVYPWHVEHLARAGTTIVPARRPPPRERPPTVSRAAARESAGPMHASVARFLAEREAWSRQPHPGRRYCR